MAEAIFTCGIIGTITAIAASYITHHVTNNLIVAAYAGSIGETLGFYTTTSFRMYV